MLADLIPPREFGDATFASYEPSERYPSQREALETLSEGFRKSKTKSSRGTPGFYLDGGFGVGKTHLLVSLYRSFKGKKLFGSFLAYTSLIGALGFAEALRLLSKFDLLCIDEFELDDPGNTMIMSRLLNDLGAKGVLFAATSNTPPNALGEGRFAAEDFRREILGISAQFEILRIDGDDYRHRPVDGHSVAQSHDQLEEWLREVECASLDSFQDLLKHLSTIHPAKFARLLQDVQRVGIRDAQKFIDQADALRFVAFVDRAYEAQVAMRSSGLPLTELFNPEMVAGAYSKKYLRAISRLHALAE
ncbi:MAG: cell division protein ZapE [Micrococcales bacterium]